MFEQNFAFSLVVSCSHAAISLWFLLFFFRFFELDFFPNGFPNPFIVPSRSSFLFEPFFDFSLVFCSHAAFWQWFSVFFSFFQSDFFRNGFHYSLLVRSGSSCLFSQWKCFQLYVRTCPAMFFYFVFCYDHMTSQPLQSCFLFIRSYNFNWSACVTSFFALSGASFLFIRLIKFLVTLDSPHSQKWLPHFEIDFYLL